MRDVLRLAIDSFLLGLAQGIALTAALAILNLGGMQAVLARDGAAGWPVLSIAGFAAVALASAGFTWRLVRREMHEDVDDALRRRLLIPAQRRRR